jgi:hypothetical protein
MHHCRFNPQIGSDAPFTASSNPSSTTYLQANGDAPSPPVFAKPPVKGTLENAIYVVVIPMSG